MSKLDNIYLIGPMGAGKTSVGKLLAKKARLPFYDSDHEIEAQTGVTISWIFDVEKEEGFREREKIVIEGLTQLTSVLVSTGGGCVITPENCERLKTNGIVVYLSIALETQLQRTHRKSGRPLINVPNPRQKLIELNEQRQPLYEGIADLTYQTDEFEPHIVAQMIWSDVQELRDKG